MSIRIGCVRIASSTFDISDRRTSRSAIAGGAATFEGASARGGAGMNEAGRRFESG